MLATMWCVWTGNPPIATMNYGYAGTKELNEALTSRFSCLQMPAITGKNLEKLI